MKPRTIYLDIIRVIACLMVILMHAPVPGEGAAAHGPFLVMNSYFTAPCVPLFLMVSGALLLPCKEGMEAGVYLRKRIAKIAGPTICFSLFYILLKVNTSNLLMGGGKTLIVSLFSIPFSAQGHGILWFMYTLAGLYMLVPVLSPWLRNAPKHEIELYLAFWLITLLYPYIGTVLDINTGETGVLYYLTGYAGYFLLGHYMSRYTLPLKWLWLITLLVLPMPVIDKVMGWNLDFYSAFGYLSVPVAVMTATLFASVKRLVEKRQLGSVASTSLALVSNLSFGIYLVHIFVMRTLLYNWSFVLGIGNYYVQTLVVTVLTFIGSFAVCWIISKLPYSQYVTGYTSRTKK